MPRPQIHTSLQKSHFTCRIDHEPNAHREVAITGIDTKRQRIEVALEESDGRSENVELLLVYVSIGLRSLFMRFFSTERLLFRSVHTAQLPGTPRAMTAQMTDRTPVGSFNDSEDDGTRADRSPLAKHAANAPKLTRNGPQTSARRQKQGAAHDTAARVHEATGGAARRRYRRRWRRRRRRVRPGCR